MQPIDGEENVNLSNSAIHQDIRYNKLVNAYTKSLKVQRLFLLMTRETCSNMLDLGG
jgi:hypothetical protein